MVATRDVVIQAVRWMFGWNGALTIDFFPKTNNHTEKSQKSQHHFKRTVFRCSVVVFIFETRNG